MLYKPLARSHGVFFHFVIEMEIHKKVCPGHVFASIGVSSISPGSTGCFIKEQLSAPAEIPTE